MTQSAFDPVTLGTSGWCELVERSTDDCLEALFDLGTFGGGAGGGLALSVLINLSVLLMVDFSVEVGATGVAIGGAVEFKD